MRQQGRVVCRLSKQIARCTFPEEGSVDALKTVVAPASAQRCLHTGQQFFLGKGLYQVVIGEHNQTLDLRDFQRTIH